jgi:hypothetical protein
VKHLNYSISEIKENMNRTSTYAINFCSWISANHFVYDLLSITQACPCMCLIDIVWYLLKARTVRPAETVIATERLFKHAHY